MKSNGKTRAANQGVTSMFFVRMGKLTATLAFGYGVFKTAAGIILAIDDKQELARRYFAAENTGQVIDKGLQVILFSIVMGILCHIAVSVAQGRRETTNPGEGSPKGF
jgi:hypothetical protein